MWLLPPAHCLPLRLPQGAAPARRAGDERAVVNWTPKINTGWQARTLVDWPASGMGTLWGYSELMQFTAPSPFGAELTVRDSLRCWPGMMLMLQLARNKTA
jgi:hypothetical protein